MNKARREEIKKVVDYIESAYMILDEIKDEEEEAFNNLPDGIAESERGEMMEENVDTMDDCINNLWDIVDVLNAM